VREALQTTAISLVYGDSVLNEAIGVLARRAQEQRRADQFAGLMNALLHEVPTDILVWLSSETQRLYDQVIELVRSTSGDLNFHDALIALGCRLLGNERPRSKLRGRSFSEFRAAPAVSGDHGMPAWVIRLQLSDPHTGDGWILD